MAGIQGPPPPPPPPPPLYPLGAGTNGLRPMPPLATTLPRRDFDGPPPVRTTLRPEPVYRPASPDDDYLFDKSKASKKSSKKFDERIEGYEFKKAAPLAGQKTTWEKVIRKTLPFSHSQLEDMINDRYGKSKRSMPNDYSGLGEKQKALVERLLKEKRSSEKSADAEWSVAYVHKETKQRKVSWGQTVPETIAIKVILQRKDLSAKEQDTSKKTKKTDKSEKSDKITKTKAPVGDGVFIDLTEPIEEVKKDKDGKDKGIKGQKADKSNGKKKAKEPIYDDYDDFEGEYTDLDDIDVVEYDDLERDRFREKPFVNQSQRPPMSMPPRPQPQQPIHIPPSMPLPRPSQMAPPMPPPISRPILPPISHPLPPLVSHPMPPPVGHPMPPPVAHSMHPPMPSQALPRMPPQMSTQAPPAPPMNGPFAGIARPPPMNVPLDIPLRAPFVDDARFNGPGLRPSMRMQQPPLERGPPKPLHHNNFPPEMREPLRPARQDTRPLDQRKTPPPGVKVNQWTNRDDFSDSYFSDEDEGFWSDEGRSRASTGRSDFGPTFPRISSRAVHNSHTDKPRDDRDQQRRAPFSPRRGGRRYYHNNGARIEPHRSDRRRQSPARYHAESRPSNRRRDSSPDRRRQSPERSDTRPTYHRRNTSDDTRDCRRQSPIREHVESRPIYHRRDSSYGSTHSGPSRPGHGYSNSHGSYSDIIEEVRSEDRAREEKHKMKQAVSEAYHQGKLDGKLDGRQGR